MLLILCTLGLIGDKGINPCSRILKDLNNSLESQRPFRKVYKVNLVYRIRVHNVHSQLTVVKTILLGNPIKSMVYVVCIACNAL